MSEKTCCVTGHRNIPASKMKYVTTKLKEEIEQAIADGFTVFITAMADGVDLLFAKLVIEKKAQHPELFLETAIPYRNRLNTTDPLFQKCLGGCNGIKVQQEENSRAALLNRNRYMVAMSRRVIAVYDGCGRGGTLFTMRYAHAMEREVREITI